VVVLADKTDKAGLFVLVQIRDAPISWGQPMHPIFNSAAEILRNIAMAEAISVQADCLHEWIWKGTEDLENLAKKEKEKKDWTWIELAHDERERQVRTPTTYASDASSKPMSQTTS